MPHIPRIKRAIEVFKNIPQTKLKMKTWHRRTECGTVMCLGGHLASDKILNEQGLYLCRVKETHIHFPAFNDYTAYDALGVFFELPYATLNKVFRPFIEDDVAIPNAIEIFSSYLPPEPETKHDIDKTRDRDLIQIFNLELISTEN